MTKEQFEKALEIEKEIDLAVTRLERLKSAGRDGLIVRCGTDPSANLIEFTKANIDNLYLEIKDFYETRLKLLDAQFDKL